MSLLNGQGVQPEEHHAASSANCWRKYFHLKRGNVRRTNRLSFSIPEILGVCSFAPSLTGLGVLLLSMGASRKARVLENTVCAAKKACHKIHLNPCVGQ